MFYLIDFDSRSAVSMATERPVLETYINNNDLSMAVVIVASEDELVMELSLVEMQALYDGISDHKRVFPDEDEAAAITWSTLESVTSTIPKFTPALGKRLIKAAGGEAKFELVTEPLQSNLTGRKATKPRAAKVPCKSKFEGAVFVTGSVEPLKGRHTQMVNLVEDNMGEATYAELCELLSTHKGRPDEHIGFAVRKGFLCVEEEL